MSGLTHNVSAQANELLDHIYEYGTNSEGVISRINSLCDAAVEQLRAELTASREREARTYGDAREAAGYAHAIKVIKRLRDSHQTATGECQSDCDFVTAWDSAIDALRGEVKP